MRDAQCPCGSGKLFQHCCGRFLEGSERAKTPEQLMRSRYTAYALGGYGDYLLATWHPATARELTAEMLGEQTVEWLGLEVLDKTQRGDHGEVLFQATYRDPDAPDTTHVMRERSAFLREGGVWRYVGPVPDSAEMPMTAAAGAPSDE